MTFTRETKPLETFFFRKISVIFQTFRNRFDSFFCFLFRINRIIVDRVHSSMPTNFVLFTSFTRINYSHFLQYLGIYWVYTHKVVYKRQQPNDSQKKLYTQQNQVLEDLRPCLCGLMVVVTNGTGLLLFLTSFLALFFFFFQCCSCCATKL